VILYRGVLFCYLKLFDWASCALDLSFLLLAFRFASEALTRPDFGGCSVTIPHKEAIGTYLDKLSPSASILGAVNTVVVEEGEEEEEEEEDNMRSDSSGAKQSQRQRQLVGHNTDWLGIFKPMRAALRQSAALHSARLAAAAATKIQSDSAVDDAPTSSSGEVVRLGIVVGAGGTARAAAYALRSLGLQAIVVNPRTPANAQAMAQDLNAKIEAAKATAAAGAGAAGARAADGGDSKDTEALASVAWAESISEASLTSTVGADVAWEVAAVVSTLPAAAGFELPEWLLPTPAHDSGAAAANSDQSEPRCADQSPPVAVLDVVYKPARTALVTQCVQHGLPIVPGATMLLEQGLEQLELWTRRTAPRPEVRAALLANVLASDTVVKEGSSMSETEALFRDLPGWKDAFPSPKLASN